MADWWKQQIGPLPAAAWIAVLAGGLGLSYFINKGAKGREQPPAEISTGTPTGVAEGPGPGVLTPLSTAIIPVGPVTNEEWAARAIEELIARNHPLELVEPAIMHYIQGAQLTAAELVYVGIAKSIIGNPPLPIPARGSTPIPTPGPSPLPGRPNIKARQLNRVTVLLSWAPVPNARTYEVRRLGGTGTTNWASVGAALTYTAIARPAKRTSYSWEVRARNASGPGPAARSAAYTLG